MRIEWLTQAVGDFEEAMNWIAERNPQAATSTAAMVYRQVEQLKLHPNLGRNGRVAGTRELVISHTHFIAPYRIRRDDHLIEILAFMHDARQWPENF